MSAADVGRTISRIAHQIIEKTALDAPEAPRVVLLGIPTRGVILAERLARNIGEFSGVNVDHGALDITLYRDDLMQKPPRPWRPPPSRRRHRRRAGDPRRRRAVLGALGALRTRRAARYRPPRAVQLAVLVDRGHRELPLRADYVGKNVPTSRSESVHVLLAEHDGRDQVVISR
ncbi:bifunctional protein pyrR [Mycobacterium xenopi 4042]|uniref:Bifunctional protein pyrR n=1 Tax=Mycobacterium xenopi 4042 TaxID=1299334 RepID=X7ZZF9_MYCXE|nr:bifunctional protein pyrR [Mycobacterium xenopi 4042]